MFSLVWQIFHNYEIKRKHYKRKQIIEVYLPKLKPLQMTLLRKCKDKLHTGRKYV